MAHTNSKLTKSEKTGLERKKNKPALNNSLQVNDLIEIDLGERLDIDHVEQFKDKITKARSSAKFVKLICETCEVIDLTFIQLIHTLRNNKEGANFELAITIDAEQTELLKKTGVYNVIFPPQ